jgi:hypothetical protein
MGNSIGKLYELMGRKPFRVPEGYFENFTEKMMSQLPENQAHPRGKKVRLFEWTRPLLAVAAVFAGLVMVFFVYMKKTDSMYADKDMIVKNISLQTISTLNKDAYSEADFFDFLAEEYHSNNVEELIDNLIN